MVDQATDRSSSSRAGSLGLQLELQLQVRLQLQLRLPAQPGALIGRAEEVARVRERLLRGDVRLLTLVGAAGTGTTRLAVEVARQAAEAFSDGTWFVDLSPVRNPELVPSAIVETLEVCEDRDRPLIEVLKEHLASRCALGVLDNFEQVLPAAPSLADLLRAGTDLKLLVTSRSALHLRWEHELVVNPLAVPDLAALPSRPAWPKSPRSTCSCSARSASIPIFAWMTATLVK
jgi:predicted ATPase